MFARFKKIFENLLNDLIVICYLLFVMFWGWCFWDEQTCVTTLLLFVICYLL